MRTVKQTNELLRPIIEGLSKTIWIENVISHGSNLYTIETLDTKWLTFYNPGITIDGVSYTIVDYLPNQWVKVNGSAPITAESFELYDPYYYHGTIQATNEELLKLKAQPWDKFPMIYLHETTQEEFNDEPGNSIDRESECEFFFMVNTKAEAWKIVDHERYAVVPMRNFLFAFIDGLKASSRVNSEGLRYTVFDHVRWGASQANKGNLAELISGNLSGTQLRITIPFYKDECCSDCPDLLIESEEPESIFHRHSNKDILDDITDSGDGTLFLADDGTYKEVTAPAGSVAWDDVTDKPATFPPSAHTHPISEITALQEALDTLQTNINSEASTRTTADNGLTQAISDEASTRQNEVQSLQDDIALINTELDGKSDVGHTHDDRYYTEEEVDTALAGKSNIGHTHAIADTTGLQAALDGKASSSHTHAATDITEDSTHRFTTDAEKTTWNGKAELTDTVRPHSTLITYSSGNKVSFRSAKGISYQTFIANTAVGIGETPDTHPAKWDLVGSDTSHVLAILNTTSGFISPARATNGITSANTPSNNFIQSYPFTIPKTKTFANFKIKVNSAVATSKLRIGFYEATSSTNTYPDALAYDLGEVDCSVAGMVTVTTSFTLKGNCVYWLSINAINTPNCIVLPTAAQKHFFTNNGTIPNNGGNYPTFLLKAQAYGAMPSTHPAAAAETAGSFILEFLLGF